MGIRHMVKRGDSLWSLAGVYLGSGTRWPIILKYHNTEAARFGRNSGLLPIDDENLIYVGQTVMVPPKEKFPAPGTGKQCKAKKVAIPLNLKVVYAIGRDTPPVQYVASNLDYTIKTELKGEIGIEIASSDRYRISLELFRSNNPMQIKQKLQDTYEPAISALTAEPEMVFESGRVKIKAPIASEANLGPYTIKVQAEAPNHLSGTLEPPTISGALAVGEREYKYSADIELKAEVIWHIRPKGGPDPVKVTAHQTEKKDFYRSTDHTSKWDQTVAEKGTVWAVVTVILYAAYRAAELFATKGMRPTTIPPFIHKIDHRNDYRHNA
jgi:hypothetical protein